MSLTPLEVTVAELHQETDQALRLVLDDGGKLSYQSGQFLTLLIETEGKVHRRCYSFCSIPEDSKPEVIIKCIEGGYVSNLLNDTLKVGQQLSVLPALGDFTTDYIEHRKRFCVFIAGGSGITPLISLLRSILTREPRTSTLLLYGNRAADQVILADSIERLALAYPDRLEVQHVWERGPLSGDAILGQLGREVQLRLLSPYVQRYEDAVYFICGPPPMRAASREALEALKVSEKCIQEESFVEDRSSNELTSDHSYQVRLLLQDEEEAFEVQKGVTILEAGIEACLDMPYSCQKGICTACRARLIEGRISYTRKIDVLSEEEIEEGYILCCSALPQTNLRIEID